jgi:hypothetical protein
MGQGLTLVTPILVPSWQERVRRHSKGWSVYGAQQAQPVATSGKSLGRRDRGNKPNLLPCVATGCRGRQMVRRGSTVRVRQRALQKPRKRGFLFRIHLHDLQRAQGMEPFMELSGPERPLASRAAPQASAFDAARSRSCSFRLSAYASAARAATARDQIESIPVRTSSHRARR